MSNVETVQAIYEAFGRFDIPPILEHLHPEVQWDSWDDWSPQKAGVPWLELRTGRDGVAEFFGVVGQLNVVDFQVLDLLGSERQVVAEVTIETGGSPIAAPYRDEELHLWTFDGDGLVVRFRHYTDTAKHIRSAAEAKVGAAVS
jgi:ketosteroid isomerase-like protein